MNYKFTRAFALIPLATTLCVGMRVWGTKKKGISPIKSS
jgi:hypothetical protein